MRPTSRLFANLIRTTAPIATHHHHDSQYTRLFATTSRMTGDELHKNDSDTSGLAEHHKRIVHENRIDRPPYSLTAATTTFHAVLMAECFCTSVQYSISRAKPLDAKFCHCQTCQRLHGAPFQWAAIVHKDDVLFTRGRDDLVYYNPGENSAEYTLPCKVACGKCRSPIMDEGRNMLMLFPTLIKFASLKEKREWYPS